MIKTNKGKIKAKGSAHELLADISVVVHSVYFEALLVHFTEEQAKEMIHDAVERALMTREQLAEHVKKDIVEALKNILEPEESEGEEE